MHNYLKVSDKILTAINCIVNQNQNENNSFNEDHFLLCFKSEPKIDKYN